MMTSYALSVQNTLTFSHHWRPQKFFQRGQNHGHFKKSTVFGAPYKKSTIFWRAGGANENLCVILRRFRLKYRVSSANAVEYFVGRQHMTFFLTSRGGQVPPSLHPLRAPMSDSQKIGPATKTYGKRITWYEKRFLCQNATF